MLTMVLVVVQGSVLVLVTDYYSKHFEQCKSARASGLPIPPLPEPLLFSLTYCGN